MLVWGLACAGQAVAQASAGIYACTDAAGHRLTSDRPIPDCSNREQRVLNRDGSVRQVVPPTLTAEERAEREAAQRKADLARQAQADAARRDRNLMTRFPDEATHRKAREAALDTSRMAAKSSEARIKDLAKERKPLLDEAEFYKGKPLPQRLKQQLDANDAAVDAQRQAIAGQEVELARINKNYDNELDRLRRLWAGTTPGSMGLAPVIEAPAPAAASAPAPKRKR
jgi:hypothetical protein